MFDKEKSDKLLELTERAVSINEKLLTEEKKFIDAVSHHEEMEVLKKINEEINALNRKETLYIEAANMLLKKSGEE